MTTRAELVALALRDDGYLDGAGYDTCNKFSTFMGHACEAWCGDTVSTWFIQAGLNLPSMQAGCRSGYSYCPAGTEYGRSHGAAIPSWQAQAGDILMADWDGDGIPDHTELVTGRVGSNLQSIGGNSGVYHALENYRGKGGVHRHYWPDPVGVGNSLILTCLNAAKLVNFSPSPAPGPVPHGNAPVWPGRVLMLKSPNMVGTDVREWQTQMVARGWTHTPDISGLPGVVRFTLGTHGYQAGQPFTADGDFGPMSCAVAASFQQQKGLGIDCQVGPATWAAAWTAPITSN